MSVPEVTEVVVDDDEATRAESPKADGMLRRLKENVLSKPSIWVLAATFLCVYLMRQGLTTWMVFYLIEGKGTLSPAQP